MFQYVEIMGHSILMYDFWNVVSTVVMFIHMMLQTKKISNISPYAVNQPSQKRKMLVGIGQVLAIIAVAFGLFKVLNPLFGNWFTNGNANYYGSLTAWFIAITGMTVIFKISPYHVHDMFAPALPIQLFFAKISCFCHGCCSGFEKFGYGYFNWNTRRFEFPVQLVEMLVALALYIIMRLYQKRNKIPGSVFPIYVILYSVSRFVTQFFRGDMENVIGPLDAYQIMSIVYVFLGICLLCVVCAHHRRASVRPEEPDSE